MSITAGGPLNIISNRFILFANISVCVSLSTNLCLYLSPPSFPNFEEHLKFVVSTGANFTPLGQTLALKKPTIHFYISMKLSELSILS